MPKFTIVQLFLAGMIIENVFLFGQQQLTNKHLAATTAKLATTTAQTCAASRVRTGDIVSSWVEFSRDSHLIAIKDNFAAGSWAVTKAGKFRSDYWTDMAAREDDLSRAQLAYAHRVETDYDVKTCGSLPVVAPATIKSHTPLKVAKKK